MPQVVVAGALANKARSGGEAWVRLSWVLGLRQLGLDVRFVEQLDPVTCTDGSGGSAPVEQSVQVRYFRDVVRDFGLAEVSTLLVGDDAVAGPSLDDLLRFTDGALLVNISGHLTHAALLKAFRARAYIDIDPGFTQIWHVQGLLGSALDQHDLHFTIGETIGTTACSIPTGGLRWRPVRQPVVLEQWPVTPSPDPGRFTTVASWRPPFGGLAYEGRTYGLKVHEFRKLMDLPTLCPSRFEIALDIHPGDIADRDRLLAAGWHLVDPAGAAGSPQAFADYVQGSGAEFSVAQGVYVDTCSGWFSDRTVRYLASGKPALVQDTGFGRHVPSGQGLLSFTGLAEAVSASVAVQRDYEMHSAAARSLAEGYFGSERVLARLVDECAGPM